MQARNGRARRTMTVVPLKGQVSTASRSGQGREAPTGQSGHARPHRGENQQRQPRGPTEDGTSPRGKSRLPDCGAPPSHRPSPPSARRRGSRDGQGQSHRRPQTVQPAETPQVPREPAVAVGTVSPCRRPCSGVIRSP